MHNYTVSLKSLFMTKSMNDSSDLVTTYRASLKTIKEYGYACT